MLQQQQPDMVGRALELQALAARLHAQAELLKIMEPDFGLTGIRYYVCGILGCNEIQSMECPPTTKDV